MAPALRMTRSIKEKLPIFFSISSSTTHYSINLCSNCCFFLSNYDGGSILGAGVGKGLFLPKLAKRAGVEPGLRGLQTRGFSGQGNEKKAGTYIKPGGPKEPSVIPFGVRPMTSS